jgi:hypothetical protein
VLNRIGLHIFVPIFKLSYQDLKNDIIKNGKIGNGYNLGNGVKKDIAQICSLFILAIEPLLRNINKNNTITAIRSRKINLTWSKIFGYEDDVTIITDNANNNITQFFLNIKANQSICTEVKCGQNQKTKYHQSKCS